MKKRIPALLLSLALLLGLFPANTSAAMVIESGFCGEDMIWTLDSDGLLTISGTGEMDDLVTEDDLWYPHRNWIRKAKIEDGVTSIGRGAFYQCSLSTISIPNSVTKIAKQAFQESSLESITIPNSVTEIGEAAFYYCDSLTDVTLPSSVTVIPKAAFCGCDSLANVTIPDSVTTISDEAFEHCHGLKRIYLPNSITDIGYWAFSGSGLTELTLPDRLTTIKAQAFSHCRLTELVIPDTVTYLGIRCFCQNEELTQVTIGSGVTEIAESAFRYCWELHDIYFLGDAPVMPEYNTFDENPEDLTLHYLAGTSGWTYPTWNGYSTAVHEHSYTSTVTEPACDTPGYITYTCTECYGSYRDSFVDAPGHAWDEGTVTAEPTGTQAGTMVYFCTVCGEAREEYLPALGATAYTDVPAGEWYYSAVDFVLKNGLMNGVSDGIFRPNGTMTRAMLVTVLWRYAGEPFAGENVFEDVPEGQWYTKAVAWAAENGIVTGVAPGRFNPDGSITREQMAAILHRYAGAQDINTSARADLSSFPDASSVSDWAEEALQWCVSEGIIGGSNGKLLPQGNATRAQVAAILMRFIENVVSQ